MSYVQDRLYDVVVAHDHPVMTCSLLCAGVHHGPRTSRGGCRMGLAGTARCTYRSRVNHKSTVMRSILTHICPTYMHMLTIKRLHVLSDTLL